MFPSPPQSDGDPLGDENAGVAYMVGTSSHIVSRTAHNAVICKEFKLEKCGLPMPIIVDSQ